MLLKELQSLQTPPLQLGRRTKKNVQAAQRKTLQDVSDSQPGRYLRDTPVAERGHDHPSGDKTMMKKSRIPDSELAEATTSQDTNFTPFRVRQNKPNGQKQERREGKKILKTDPDRPMLKIYYNLMTDNPPRLCKGWLKVTSKEEYSFL
jgi:hypothetical protein